MHSAHALLTLQAMRPTRTRLARLASRAPLPLAARLALEAARALDARLAALD